MDSKQNVGTLASEISFAHVANMIFHGEILTKNVLNAPAIDIAMKLTGNHFNGFSWLYGFHN